jgi:hypothetical protein
MSEVACAMAVDHPDIRQHESSSSDGETSSAEVDNVIIIRNDG